MELHVFLFCYYENATYVYFQSDKLKRKIAYTDEIHDLFTLKMHPFYEHPNIANSNAKPVTNNLVEECCICLLELCFCCCLCFYALQYTTVVGQTMWELQLDKKNQTLIFRIIALNLSKISVCDELVE